MLSRGSGAIKVTPPSTNTSLTRFGAASRCAQDDVPEKTTVSSALFGRFDTQRSGDCSEPTTRRLKTVGLASRQSGVKRFVKFSILPTTLCPGIGYQATGQDKLTPSD